MPVHKAGRVLAKRYAAGLRECQEKDYPLPTPCIFSIKYRFSRLGHKYQPISVESDALEGHTLIVDRGLVPDFILSQLESQKLIPESIEKVPISRLVDFALRFFPINTSEGFPTLLRTWSKAKHRHFFIFLFSRIKMSSKRCYTIEQLESLRKEAMSDELQHKLLEDDPELGVIVYNRDKKPRFPERSSSAATDGKKTKKTKPEDTSSSEELLFKGRTVRRCASKSSSDKFTRRSGLALTREVSEKASSETVAPRMAAEGPKMHSKDVDNDNMGHEWKYRGRSETDAKVKKPIPAPVGKFSQKSEGFQRFYKAVVSPTHVRVTAGGRIVPNTRSSATPSSPVPSLHPTEAPLASDLHSLPDKAEQAPSTVEYPGLGATHGLPPALPHMMPPMMHGYPHPMSPMVAPYMLPYGPPPGHGFPFHPPPLGFHPISMPPVPFDPATLKEKHNTKRGDNSLDKDAANDKADSAHVSPPEQFDGTRPFMYNGHMMYPVPAHFTHPPAGFVPMPPMYGVPPGIPPQFAGPMMGPPPPGMIPVLPPSAYCPAPAGAPPAPPPPQGMPVPATMAAGQFYPPKRPAAATTIRMSSITKNQIGGFKSDLKYFEDQLQYNRHQIDEAHINDEIKKTKENIAKFEEVLKKQLEGEEKSVAAQGESSNPVTVSRSGKESSTATPPPAETPNLALPQPRLLLDGKEDHQIRGTRNVNYSDSASGSVAYDFGEAGRLSFHPSIHSSALPSEAALAPPFQPRGNVDVASFDPRFLAQESQAAVELRLLAAASWQPVDPENSIPNCDWLAAPSAPGGVAQHGNAKPGEPYLIGISPDGESLVSQTGRYPEYQYSRPLSGEEVRARELYWGKALSSDRQGLPKFDGRNFYRASPKKGTADSGVSLKGMHQDPLGRSPIIRHSISNDQTETDPFRPSTPVQQTAVVPDDSSSDESPRGSMMHGQHDTRVAHSAAATEQKKSQSRISAALKVLKPKENSADNSSMTSQERRTDKTGSAKLWQTVIKKPSASSALSSTTAQGYLPQYTGHAAASLSPSVNKAPESPGKGLNVSDSSDGGVLVVPGDHKQQEENRPLHDST